MTVNQFDVCRFDVIGDFDEVDEVVGVYHAQYRSVGEIAGSVAVQDWKTIFADIWAIVLGVHSILTVYRRVRGYNVTTSTLLGESAFGTPLVGTAGDDAAPPQVTFPLTFKTLYPRIMLRKFFGPSAEINLDADGRYNSGAISDMVDVAAFLMAPLETGGREYLFGYPSPVAATFVTPTVAVMSTIPGTIRSRRVGVGS